MPATARLLPLLAVSFAALAGCGSTVSTSSFKGTQHEVAQTIADLQSDATAGDEGKICSKDLAAPVVARLGGKKACEKAVKDQLGEVSNLEVSVSSVQVDPSGKHATAEVRSTFEGKRRTTTMTLVREGERWKIASFG